MNRNTPQIYADVLSVAKDTDRDGIAVTTLCRKSNLSYSRLKGFNYLDEYKRLVEFAEGFGFEI